MGNDLELLRSVPILFHGNSQNYTLDLMCEGKMLEGVNSYLHTNASVHRIL